MLNSGIYPETLKEIRRHRIKLSFRKLFVKYTRYAIMNKSAFCQLSGEKDNYLKTMNSENLVNEASINVQISNAKNFDRTQNLDFRIQTINATISNLSQQLSIFQDTILQKIKILEDELGH